MKKLTPALIILFLIFKTSIAFSQNFTLKALELEAGINTLQDNNFNEQGYSTGIKYVHQQNYFAGAIHLSYNTVPYTITILPYFFYSYSTVFSGLGGFGLYSNNKKLSDRILSGISFVSVHTLSAELLARERLVYCVLYMKKVKITIVLAYPFMQKFFIFHLTNMTLAFHLLQ